MERGARVCREIRPRRAGRSLGGRSGGVSSPAGGRDERRSCLTERRRWSRAERPLEERSRSPRQCRGAKPLSVSSAAERDAAEGISAVEHDAAEGFSAIKRDAAECFSAAERGAAVCGAAYSDRPAPCSRSAAPTRWAPYREPLSPAGRASTPRGEGSTAMWLSSVVKAVSSRPGRGRRVRPRHQHGRCPSSAATGFRSTQPGVTTA